MKQPTELFALHAQVRQWVKRARNAVLTYKRDDGSFWRDSEQPGDEADSKRTNPTITARAYMALVYADRCLAKPGKSSATWAKDFSRYLESRKFNLKDNLFVEVPPGAKEGKLNNFEAAHLADLFFVEDYLKRFSEGFGKRNKALDKIRRPLSETLMKNLGGALAAKDARLSTHLSVSGQIAFETGITASCHHFVSLHTLRALAILDQTASIEQYRSDIAGHARQFCIEQCFYSHEKVRHQQDSIRLAFACVIYCLYGQTPEVSLCTSVINALGVAQQDNGIWPATHPIIRNRKRPWHISSHEIALCLTWLYFQPRLPDIVRPTLLAMMEKYFNNFVVPSFRRVPNRTKNIGAEWFAGWFDDHTNTPESAVGWATAVVCHFLANYADVLADNVNRMVIEGLGLGNTSSGYLIDETSRSPSVRWGVGDQSFRPSAAIWPDLPPYAWSVKWKDSEQLAKSIRWNWTDPTSSSESTSISINVASKVLWPILENPAEKPQPARCSGLLAGSPGTRKTTLVRTLADIIQWPMVTVPASVIFDSGYDMMETRATEVFGQLNHLTRCVIFFDEFEEFFRSREGSSASIHDRTIAAFTTSSMLPRLQDLHNQERCLIFVATNHEDAIDEAIKRAGRLEFRLLIEHPTRQSIEKYLEAPTKKAILSLGLRVEDAKFEVHADDAARLKQITGAAKTAVEELFSAHEVVRFVFVESALTAAKKADPKNMIGAARKALKEARSAASRKEPPNLSDL